MVRACVLAAAVIAAAEAVVEFSLSPGLAKFFVLISNGSLDAPY